MSLHQLSQHLMRLDIFQDLTPLHMTEIVRRAERVVFKPGQTLIANGEAGDAAVIPIAGEAVRTGGLGVGGEEPIEQGSLLGEMAMLIDTDYSSTVVARTPVKALRIARRDMLEMMAEDPALADHFLHKMSGRLQRIAAELRDIEESLASSTGGAAHGAADDEGADDAEHALPDRVRHDRALPDRALIAHEARASAGS